jgi:serine/threonine protein kinase
VLKGKAAYMAPEQILSKPIDHRADVFALGIVLYELTTASRLYERTTELATMRQILLDDVPPPTRRVRGYPPALERIVLRALAADPARRYPSAAALREAIEDVARELGLRLGARALAGLVSELRTPVPRASGASGGATIDEPTELDERPSHERGRPVAVTVATRHRPVPGPETMDRRCRVVGAPRRPPPQRFAGTATIDDATMP